VLEQTRPAAQSALRSHGVTQTRASQTRPAAQSASAAHRATQYRVAHEQTRPDAQSESLSQRRKIAADWAPSASSSVPTAAHPCSNATRVKSVSVRNVNRFMSTVLSVRHALQRVPSTTAAHSVQQLNDSYFEPAVAAFSEPKNAIAVVAVASLVRVTLPNIRCTA
jgi:hypothetical protein